MKLRVFFTIHEKASELRYGGHKYSREQRSLDFDSEMRPEEAFEQIYNRVGRLNTNKPNAPVRYATIHSHSIVDETLERGAVETFSAIEQSLLTPQMLKAALKDSPSLRRKKRVRAE